MVPLDPVRQPPPALRVNRPEKLERVRPGRRRGEQPRPANRSRNGRREASEDDSLPDLKGSRIDVLG